MELTARGSSGSVVTSTWHRGDTEEPSMNMDFSVVCPTCLALHLVWCLQIIEDGQNDRCHRLLGMTFPVTPELAIGPRTEDKRRQSELALRDITGHPPASHVRAIIAHQ